MKYTKGFSILLAALISAPAFGANSPFIPNSRKYADVTPKASTGRSGSAQLSALALIGADGGADLTVTSSRIDSSVPEGRIEKVQVKLGEGATAQTLNFNGLNGGSSFSVRLEGLLRGETLQVQANVKDIDPKRTDVVTATPIAQLRPDLAVLAIDAPSARVNVPAVIRAEVAELNGDLGAEADCVLSLGGAVIDRAVGIVVAKGDVNTCVFSHVFAVAGKYNVEVSLRNVKPGDFNGSNNALSAEIEITSADNFQSYLAKASEVEKKMTGVTTSTLGTREGFQVSKQITGSASFSGRVGPLDRRTASIAVSYASGSFSNSVFHDLSTATFTPSGCVARTGKETVQVCASATATDVTVLRNSGTISFHSEGWDKTMLNADGSFFTWNQDVAAQFRFGSSFEFKVVVADAASTYTANPIFSLLETKVFGTPVTNCVNNARYGQLCTKSWTDTTTLSGQLQK